MGSSDFRWCGNSEWSRDLSKPLLDRQTRIDFTADIGGCDVGYAPEAALIWGKAHEFGKQLRDVLGFVEEVVHLDGTDHWRGQYEGFRNLFGSSFGETDESLVTFSVLPHKPRTDNVADSEVNKKVEVLESPEPVAKPIAETKAITSTTFEFQKSARPPGWGCELNGFCWAYSNTDAKPNIIQNRRERRIRVFRPGMGRREHTAIERPVYAAHLVADKLSVKNGWVPEQNQHYDAETHILWIPHVTITKMKPGIRTIKQYNIGILPEAGSLTSLMDSERSPRMFLIQHPIDRQLFENSPVWKKWEKYSA